ncbi:MAG: spore coat associated protein CotJA [Sporomusaceae bacterium]|nr:spore coat associated protein CotJA [Sporomusaceae bacterium]
MEELYQDDEFLADCQEDAVSREGRFVLAHAYVPWQFYKRAYKPAEALCKGTLFPELFGVYPIPK